MGKDKAALRASKSAVSMSVVISILDITISMTSLIVTMSMTMKRYRGTKQRHIVSPITTETIQSTTFTALLVLKVAQ
eukprot:210390-Pelagomonas_calceolata.AAC.13